MSKATLTFPPAPRNAGAAASPEKFDGDFTGWLKAAEPGQSVIYFTGELAVVREINPEVARLASWAMHLAALGWVDLLQRRVGDNTFAYIAVKRSAPAAPARRMAA